jgi:hypothetical protein
LYHETGFKLTVHSPAQRGQQSGLRACRGINGIPVNMSRLTMEEAQTG